ncbi:TPA: GNAT family N-acetyltransferase, partial [Stenotrophomonas maltophilia]
VQAALRRFVTARHDKQLRVIVHDAAAIASAGAPLLALAQRLPSVIQFREATDPVDRALASACLLNDAGDFYFRLIGHRLDGEAGVALPARSQPFEQQLQRVWDRSRDCSELRALGI